MSRELAEIVEAEQTAVQPDEQVIRRNIGTSPLPSTAWADAVVGQQLPQDFRTAAQKAAVDRFTFNAHILETGTQSYRLRTGKNASRRRRTG